MAEQSTKDHRVDDSLGSPWVVPNGYFNLLDALDEPAQPLAWIRTTAANRQKILSDAAEVNVSFDG